MFVSKRIPLISVIVLFGAIVFVSYFFYLYLNKNMVVSSPETATSTTPVVKYGFEIIKDGLNNSHREKRNYIITKNSDWAVLWERAFAGEPAPEIDFKKEIVVAVFMGPQSTGGYKIEITDLIETEDGLEINIVESSPSASCVVAQVLTEPHYIIKTKKTKQDINFKINQKTIPC